MPTEQEIREIMRGASEVLLKLAASIVAPLYWIDRSPDAPRYTRNGTAFFLQTNEALFGVTAAHVIEGWREHCEQFGKTNLRLGAKAGVPVEFDWDARHIDINPKMDLATFKVSLDEIKRLDRTAYSGHQTCWPPELPPEKQGILYAGCPGVGTWRLPGGGTQFGIVCNSGFVDSINPCVVSSTMQREQLEPILGGIPPENFDYGGISAGPMLYNYLSKGGILVTALAGVVYSGPNTSDDPNRAIPGFELFRARPAMYIRSDGFLDHDLWTTNQ